MCCQCEPLEVLKCENVRNTKFENLMKFKEFDGGKLNALLGEGSVTGNKDARDGSGLVAENAAAFQKALAEVQLHSPAGDITVSTLATVGDEKGQ